MPYYKNKHILFIHIPKTGGSTIENEMKKNDIQLLRSGKTNTLLPHPLNKISLQHQLYIDIVKYKEVLKIQFDDKLKVFCVVRNPYHRVVSDLFFNRLIKFNTPPREVTNVIKNYIRRTDLDNHNIPQYKFVCDEKNNLFPNIEIFKTETLCASNDKINRFVKGNLNLHNQVQRGTRPQCTYMSYLNKESISIINSFYRTDFELFGYTMLTA